MTKKQTASPHDNVATCIIGSGYIGKMLACELLRQKPKAKLSGTVRSQQSALAGKQLGLDLTVLDLDKPTDIQSFIRHRIAGYTLYYLAPPPGTGQLDTRAATFTLELTQCLKQTPYLAPQKIVLISTTGVYGDCHGQWVDETAQPHPILDRAKRRLHAEQQFQVFCDAHNIPLIILRVAGIYGPDRLPLSRIRAGTPIVRQQDSPWSNRIHAQDLVTVCVESALNENIQGIFNCADGNPSTMHDYFVKVALANHLPAPPSISLSDAQRELSEGMLSYMGESRRVSNTKLLKTFNLKLKYPDLATGLTAICGRQ